MNPPLLTLPDVARDSALAGSLLIGIGSFFEAGVGVAAGVAGALVNLLLWMRVVRAGSGVAMVVRMMGKQLSGAALLVALVVTFPPGPVLVGFCTVILGVAVRAALELLRRVPAEST